jgi:hypothetical protein
MPTKTALTLRLIDLHTIYTEATKLYRDAWECPEMVTLYPRENGSVGFSFHD